MGKICDKIKKIMKKGTVICLDDDTLGGVYEILKEAGIEDEDDQTIFLYECVNQMTTEDFLRYLHNKDNE